MTILVNLHLDLFFNVGPPMEDIFFWTPSKSCISIIITHYNYKFPFDHLFLQVKWVKNFFNLYLHSWWVKNLMWGSSTAKKVRGENAEHYFYRTLSVYYIHIWKKYFPQHLMSNSFQTVSSVWCVSQAKARQPTICVCERVCVQLSKLKSKCWRVSCSRCYMNKREDWVSVCV